jgi:D-serine deaminase-like pyridoxal phosphate-dependent protein
VPAAGPQGTMSSNYPLPSKASLVQQFVGKTLKEIPLPAAVVDIAAVKRNCQRMSDVVKELGFDFVPLVNIHRVRMQLFYFIAFA